MLRVLLRDALVGLPAQLLSGVSASVFVPPHGESDRTLLALGTLRLEAVRSPTDTTYVAALLAMLPFRDQVSAGPAELGAVLGYVDGAGKTHRHRTLVQELLAAALVCVYAYVSAADTRGNLPAAARVLRTVSAELDAHVPGADAVVAQMLGADMNLALFNALANALVACEFASTALLTPVSHAAPGPSSASALYELTKNCKEAAAELSAFPRLAGVREVVVALGRYCLARCCEQLSEARAVQVLGTGATLGAEELRESAKASLALLILAESLYRSCALVGSATSNFPDAERVGARLKELSLLLWRKAELNATTLREELAKEDALKEAAVVARLVTPAVHAVPPARAGHSRALLDQAADARRSLGLDTWTPPPTLPAPASEDGELPLTLLDTIAALVIAAQRPEFKAVEEAAYDELLRERVARRRIQRWLAAARAGSVTTLRPPAADATPAPAAATPQAVQWFVDRLVPLFRPKPAAAPAPAPVPVETGPMAFDEWLEKMPAADAWQASGRLPASWAAWPRVEGAQARFAWLARYTDEEWHRLGVTGEDMKLWGLTAANVLEARELRGRWNVQRALQLFGLQSRLSAMMFKGR